VRALIAAGGISLFLALFATPVFIRIAKKLQWGQFIRDDGPQTHQTKRGTPTMGGVVILGSATLAYLIAKFANEEVPSPSALLVIFMMLGLGAVGFMDDFLKVRNQRSLGLGGWAKIAGQAAVAITFAILALQFPDAQGLTPASTHISLFRDLPIDLFFWGSTIGMILFIAWIFLLVASSSNGVNIADGLDGLASGSAVIAIGAYVVIGFWQFNQSCRTAVENISACYEVRDPLDLAVVSAAIVGACLGFLWWNTSPAQLIMGDTGSQGLGGALAALAILSRTELLLILIGGLFVIVTASVVLQRGYFKYTKWRTGVGKRIFRMSPLHHHFELKGWAEITIVVRFWIISALCVAAGVGLFYVEWVYGL
jgi:phospho-N-acetylmuramoyl-pentapeptide-transferase